MLVPTNLSNCSLRTWRGDDKNALVHHANNRKVWRNLTEMFPHPYTAADADRWISFATRAGPSVHLAIEFESAAVGGIGVIAGQGISRYTGQFGYWLGESHWGKGIATAACRAMIAHVLVQHQFLRLEAPVFEWNAASMRVLEKVGFQREGVLRKSVFKDGQLIDSVMYALVRDA
ncbi:MAG TPA: GNAT family protein [Burkholderiaceae bacterium]|nr:GNAT family protein [Burkholderiaceae bacterium]